MMTASSVEFFPCRVQLMGLPRSTATTATASSGDLPTALAQRNTPNITQTTSTVTYRRPPLAKVQGVSRNLFGSPKPGEINQLFQKEAQRQRSYVLQRYNFDIASGKPTTKQQHPTAAVVKANTNINERYLVTQIPGSLIERELQEHEQRLQKEKCSLNRSPPEEIKCSNFKQKATTNLSSGLKVLRNRTINPSITCQGDSTLPAAATSAAPGASLLLSSSSERYKPYSRQTLITECFNLRKNKQFIAAGSGGVVGKVIKTATKYEVLKLPREEITTATVTATTTTAATTIGTGTSTGTSCQLRSTDLSVNNKKCLEDRYSNNNNNNNVNNNLQTDNTKSNTRDTNNDDDNDNDNGVDDDDIDTLTATAGTTIMLQVSVSAQKASPNMTSISTANAPHTHHA